MVLNFMSLPCIDDILVDAWFLEIDFIYKAGMHVCAHMCVCVAFTSKVIKKQCCDEAWYEPIMIKQVLQLYMAVLAIVGIMSRFGLTIDEHHRNQPNKSKLML